MPGAELVTVIIIATSATRSVTMCTLLCHWKRTKIDAQRKSRLLRPVQTRQTKFVSHSSLSLSSASEKGALCEARLEICMSQLHSISGADNLACIALSCWRTLRSFFQQTIVLFIFTKFLLLLLPARVERNHLKVPLLGPASFSPSQTVLLSCRERLVSNSKSKRIGFVLFAQTMPLSCSKFK